MDYSPPQPPPSLDGTSLILRLIALVGAVLVVCIGALWYARNAKKNKPANPGTADKLKLEGTLLLDRKCALHIINVEGQQVAVTTDAGGLKSVVVLAEPFENALEQTETESPAS